MELRRTTPDDEDFLWRVLYFASHSNDEAGVEPDDIRSDPVLQRYVAGWGRHGDLGVIAESADEDIGAAWLRLFPIAAHDDPAFIDASVPELAVAVLPGFQGRGIGTRMMQRLFALARGPYPAIVLSVRADNEAACLYRRLGFTEVDRIVNRVGTESIKMVLSLS